MEPYPCVIGSNGKLTETDCVYELKEKEKGRSSIYMSIDSLNRRTPFAFRTPSTPSGMRYDDGIELAPCADWVEW